MIDSTTKELPDVLSTKHYAALTQLPLTKVSSSLSSADDISMQDGPHTLRINQSALLTPPAVLKHQAEQITNARSRAAEGSLAPYTTRSPPFRPVQGSAPSFLPFLMWSLGSPSSSSPPFRLALAWSTLLFQEIMPTFPLAAI